MDSFLCSLSIEHRQLHPALALTGSSTSDRRAALCKEKKTVQLLSVVGCFCSLLMKLCLDCLTKPLKGEPIPKYQSSDIRFNTISNRYEMHLCPQGRAPPISFWNILLMNLIKAGQAKQKMEAFLFSVSLYHRIMSQALFFLLFTLIISFCRLNCSLKNGHISLF